MAMTLDQWQERLQSHFTQLASARAYSDYRLSALEHDLTDEEFDEITDLLHAVLKNAWKLGRHWLVWVVYATELGYDYDGDEYWSSFEARTPGWRESITATRRNQLRTWFEKFQTTYQGVKPSGPWAEWFSIIAWPITHAILPKYLQWQFAKNLYDLRHQLARLESISARAVGELLARNAWDAPSRFREFLEQQELAGRLVLALLSDRNMEAQTPVYLPTLNRIVADLEDVQSTREWLGETRRLVADRLKGAARAVGGTQGQQSSDYDGGGDGTSNRLHIRPTLMLRHTTAKVWSVVIDIPSFSELAKSQPELHTLLRRTRCKITGTGDTWLPNGWLLATSRRRVLKNWPGEGVTLVTFERPTPELDQWVARETRLSSGPTWVCRIGNDGHAHEIAGRMVRPGRRYILLSENADAFRSPLVTPCSLDCTAIHAAFLSMPEAVTFETARALQKLGLQVSRTVRVWPAGLSARGFDGEGRSEWLTTEAPCFGIAHDHAVDAYTLRLSNGDETLVKAAAVGVPVFVKLKPLPPGRHTLLVKTRQAYSPGVATQPPAQGIITLDVREPEPWVPGTTSHAGLAVLLDSANPDLDGFWEGHVGVTILGPPGRQVTCSIHLQSASGKDQLNEVVGSFDLPVSPADWSKKLDAFVKEERRAWSYLEASSGRLVITGEELGEYVIRLDRDVTPLRWVCRNTGRQTTIRLIEDSGSDSVTTCRFFGLRTPATPINLDNETTMLGFDVPAPGGIFETRQGKWNDSILVSTPIEGRGFADLAIEPNLQVLDEESVPMTEILDAVMLWSGARLVGPLVAIRRNRIIERLVNRLFKRLCGDRWADAEAAFLSHANPSSARLNLEHAVAGPNGFSFVLSREFDRMDAGTQLGVQWFRSVASRYQVCLDQSLPEFALQFASHPYELPQIPKQLLEGWLNELKQKVVLIRGARLVSLLAGKMNPGPFGPVFPRWTW